jgi:hypothetical protein
VSDEIVGPGLELPTDLSFFVGLYMAGCAGSAAKCINGLGLLDKRDG